MPFNFTYTSFIILSTGERSKKEIFERRLKTYTREETEVKEAGIKKKKYSHCLCREKNLLLTILHIYMTKKNNKIYIHTCINEYIHQVLHVNELNSNGFENHNYVRTKQVVHLL